MEMAAETHFRTYEGILWGNHEVRAYCSRKYKAPVNSFLEVVGTGYQLLWALEPGQGL